MNTPIVHNDRNSGTVQTALASHVCTFMKVSRYATTLAIALTTRHRKRLTEKAISDLADWQLVDIGYPTRYIKPKNRSFQSEIG